MPARSAVPSSGAGKYGWGALCPIGLILILAALLYGSARETSVTADEFAHLPAGLAYYQTGRFTVYHQNPPLLRLLAAAPLFGQGVRVPQADLSVDRWHLGTAFMRAVGRRYHAIFMQARSVILVLTCATAWLLYWSCRRVLGARCALVALVLFCFCPTVLAHGALVTTDAALMCAFLAACITGARFLMRPTGGRTLAFGAVLGLAQLTKFTALLLYPLLFLALFATPLLPRHGAGLRARRLCVVLVVSLLLLNAGYLFQGTGRALGEYQLAQPLLAALAATPLSALPLPLPEDFVAGFDAQYREASGHFWVYLLGTSSREGWWYYWPAALWMKLPLPLWIMLGGVAYLLATRRLQAAPPLIAAAAVVTLSLLLFMLLTNINIGVRYLLFLLPLLHLIAAHLAVPPLTRARRVVLLLLLGWYCASSLASYPRYLAYFSEAVGGPARGYRLLADSNLDWGQDLIELKRWMDERGIDSVALSHFGLVDPAVYGIAWEPLGPAPRSDIVVISTNHLLGLAPWSPARYVEPYRERVPRERIGASLWVFDRIAP